MISTTIHVHAVVACMRLINIGEKFLGVEKQYVLTILSAWPQDRPFYVAVPDASKLSVINTVSIHY